MATKKVTQVCCDRCEKVIDGAVADDTTKKAPLLYVEGGLLTEEKKIHLVDLCDKCKSRVQTLLGQIRLDEPVKGDDAKPAVGDNAGSTKVADAAAAKP
jgi:hypothetical protein